MKCSVQAITESKLQLSKRIAHTSTFGKPPWFDMVASEYEACRESIGLCDYSSFAKLDIWVT